MLHTPLYWPDALAHLSADPVMARFIAAYDGEFLASRGDAFYTLARAIVGQQISVKAADSVWGKLEALYTRQFADPKDQTNGSAASAALGSPSSILSTPEADLRACGLSHQKVAYLTNIAEFFERHRIGPGYFDAMDDEEVIRHISEIKGIGRWTAEMFLIFHLMRPNVFPVDDIGVQNAILRYYPEAMAATERRMARSVKGGKRQQPKKVAYAAFRHIAEAWQPYRSVATWYLWRSLDPVPVCY